MKVRVVSYNIHKCIGGVDRRYDPARTVACLEHYQPDVVLLQEVDAGARRSNGDHQATLLAEGLGLTHYAWFPNVAVRGGGSYGNAVCRAIPLDEIRNIDLTVAPKKRRSALHVACRIRHPDGHHRTVHVFNLHLGLAQYERRIQVEHFVESHPLHGLAPRHAGGDRRRPQRRLGLAWPSWLAPHGFARRRAAGADVPGLGAAARPRRHLRPRRGALRPASSRGETELARRASDHRPLIADLTIG
jgi:endonuclease/exonuclease/phosphatase family metal-dependent hydrolase